MNQMNYSITVNLRDTRAVDTGIRLKQGDANMKLVFNVFIDDEAYFVSTDCPEIVFKRPNGTTVIATTVADATNEQYYYLIRGNELQYAGKVVCDLKFNRSSSATKSTYSFILECVANTIMNDSPTGANVYEVSYAEVLEDVRENVELVEAQVEIAKASATSASASKDSCIESVNLAADNATSAMNWALEAERQAQSASGANVVDYDATTSTLSIKRDSTVLDTTTIVAGGGTTVSVDAIETTGTHIADITVDGTKTELYAPEGGSDVDIVTSWETSPSDAKVPSEKLVKESLESLNDDLVPKTRTVCGKALSSDITLTASDVGVPANGIFYDDADPSSASVQTMEWKLLADTTSATIPSGAKEICIIILNDAKTYFAGSAIIPIPIYSTMAHFTIPANNTNRVQFGVNNNVLSFESGDFTKYLIYYR